MSQSNQDLINYQLSLIDQNNTEINTLTQQNVQLNVNIDQLNNNITSIQALIATNTDKITALQAGNVMINETIAFIPPENKNV